MSSDNRFVLRASEGMGTADPAIGRTDCALRTASTGGEALLAFFAESLGTLQHFYALIAAARGDSIWIDARDSDGNPMRYVMDGDRFFALGVKLDDPGVVEGGTGGADDLVPVGSGYIALTTEQGTSQQAAQTLLYGGPGIPGLSGSDVGEQILDRIVDSVQVYVQTMIDEVSASPLADPPGAEKIVAAAAEAAAETATEVGIEVAGELLDIVVEIPGLSVLQAVGSLAENLVTALLTHPRYDYVRFYNATGRDVSLGLAWSTGNTVALAPAPVGETRPVPGIGAVTVPPDQIGSTEGIFFSDCQVTNADLVQGLGYVLQASPVDGFPGFQVAVEVPQSGENSMTARFGVGDPGKLWLTGEHALTLQIDSEDGRYRLLVSTNQLRGKSPSPVNATEGYNFCHLVVLLEDPPALDEEETP